MSNHETFEPNLNILPSSQRRLWSEFVNVPPEFTLYGGTAIALYLGHRHSVDFDFFGSEKFDPDQLKNNISFLRETQVIQKTAHSLTCLVDCGEIVQVSFFGVPEIKPIQPPLITKDIGLKVASLIDLAGMKAAVVQKRAEAKDYIDLDAMIQSGVIDLPTALAAGQQIYSQGFNPLITLKALSFFEDGNLASLPPEVCDRLNKAVQSVDLNSLPNLNTSNRAREKSHHDVTT